MQADPPRHPVVAGVDGSECALQAVRWAAAEAARRHLPGTTRRWNRRWRG